MNLPKPLRCSEIVRKGLLKALINRMLDPSVEDLLLSHLRTCPKCLSKVARIVDDSDWMYKQASSRPLDMEAE
jgi:hypothetical protein